MEEKIIAFISELVGADDGEIEKDTELFEEGILDSFGLVQLFVWLEEQGMKLDTAELERSQISTVAKLTKLLG